MELLLTAIGLSWQKCLPMVGMVRENGVLVAVNMCLSSSKRETPGKVGGCKAASNNLSVMIQ